MTCINSTSLYFHRPLESHLSPEEAQNQPEASHAFHHLAAPGPGAEVQAEAVPVHRRAGRVLHLPDPDRDPGQDLVPEPKGQGQAAPGGRAGKTQDGCRRKDSSGCGGHRRGLAPWFHLTAVAGRHVAVRAAVLCLPPPAPQTRAAHPTPGPVRCSAGLQHVPLILKMEISLTSAVSKDT